MNTLDQFPILKFRREDGDHLLLGYRLTDKEQALFTEMDEAGLAVPEDSELEAYYQIVIPIGRRHGLDETQAIAFWTRTTFSSFEP